MRMYLKNKRALAYFSQKASSEFWDTHWNTENLRNYILSHTSDGLFLPLIKKYLPTGSVILEGGCGQGQLVYALQQHQYIAIGIDFAPNTVNKVKKAVPELNICLGDVRKLPIESKTLQGYLSIGVIEHFWEGYDLILEEMRRVLVPGGYLFISFPYMSPLRKLKAKLGCYHSDLKKEHDKGLATFYQFALDWKLVVQDLHNLGFSLQESIPWDGIKGLKDELTWLKPLLQPIYDGKKHQRLRPYIDQIFTPTTSHSIILVMKKDN